MYNWRYFLILDGFRSENIAINRRSIRDASNPMELPELCFQTKFRLTKEAFMYVLNEIKLREGMRRTYIPPVMRLAVTLEMLAGGGYQWQTGGAHTAPMGSSTLSKVFRQTLTSMEEHLCSQWICFEKHFQQCKEWFSSNYNFPGVVGAVDGTHLQLLKPIENEHIYFNRKGKHSINAMIICDHKLRIRAICPKYGGAAHDSFVWKASAARMVMERRYNNGDKNSWLLGDSGYPLEPWLMTPYRLQQNEADASKFRYNEIHSKARSIVERSIGVYKGRWRILSDDRKPRYNPTLVAKIGNVCAALHNVCITYNVQFTSQNSNNEALTSLQGRDINVTTPAELNREAERIRSRIKDSFSQTGM